MYRCRCLRDACAEGDRRSGIPCCPRQRCIGQKTDGKRTPRIERADVRHARRTQGDPGLAQRVLSTAGEGGASPPEERGQVQGNSGDCPKHPPRHGQGGPNHLREPKQPGSDGVHPKRVPGSWFWYHPREGCRTCQGRGPSRCKGRDRVRGSRVPGQKKGRRDVVCIRFHGTAAGRER